MPRLGVGQAVTHVDIVCRDEVGAASGDIHLQGLVSAKLLGLEHFSPLHVRLKRPLVAFQTEDGVLLAVRTEHVNPYLVSHMGLNDRGHRIGLACGEVGILKINLVFLSPPSQGFNAVVDSRQPRALFGVRHEGGADDVILILEEEGGVSVVGLTLVLGNGGVDHHVRAPAVLQGDIPASGRIVVPGTTGPNDDGAVKPIAHILGHVTPVGDHGRRLAILGMGVERVGVGLTRGHGLVTLVVAQVDPQRIVGVIGKHVSVDRSPTALEPVGELDLDDISDIGADDEWIGHLLARLGRRHLLIKHVALAIGILSDDLPVGGLGLDGGRSQRVQVDGQVDGRDIEGLDRRVIRPELLG